MLLPLENANFKVDRFMHTFTLKNINNRRSNEINETLYAFEAVLLEPFASVTYESQSRYLEEFRLSEWIWKRKDPFRDRWSSLRNLGCQLHSIHQVTLLWQNSGHEYDVIIYARPDVFFYNNIIVQDMENLISECQSLNPPHAWFVPSFHRSGGINDRFAYGCSRAMAIWGHRIRDAKTFRDKEKWTVRPERLLKFVAKKNNVSVHYLSIAFTRIRASGKPQAYFRNISLPTSLHYCHQSPNVPLCAPLRLTIEVRATLMSYIDDLLGALD